MRPYAISLLSMILLVCGMALNSHADTAGPACATENVFVRAATPQEAVLVCAGIADSMNYFREHGSPTDVTIDGKVHAGDSADPALPFEDELEINPMVYSLAPDMFAVQSWRYFEAQEDRDAYLQRIMQDNLAGTVYRQYMVN